MNKKLDITIGAVGCLVAMKIHHMDERFRVKEDTSHFTMFTASNGFQVWSRARPALYFDSIYLLGSNNEEDDQPYTREFDSPKRAQECVDKVLIALKEWSTEWEGWGDNEKSILTHNRYTF